MLSIFIWRVDLWCSIYIIVLLFMIRRPPGSTRTDTLFPYTTLFQSSIGVGVASIEFASDGVVRRLPTVMLVGDAVLPSFAVRSEEHTSELQSLMRISYAVFCLKKTNYYSTYSITKSASMLRHTMYT